MIQIIEALEFGSTNTVRSPMMQALALIKRYKAEAGNNRVKCHALGETVAGRGDHPGRAGGAAVPGRQQTPAADSLDPSLRRR